MFFLCTLFFNNVPCFATSKKQRIDEYKHRRIKLEQKRKEAHNKVQQIKKQQYKALIQLRSNQNKLESAKASLKDQQFRLGMAKDNLDDLQENLVKLNNDQSNLKTEVGKRIRQIYKGEKLSTIRMILEAKDIASFLDRIYYQQKIVKRDKDVLEKLKEKTCKLMVVRNKLRAQKENIISTINVIEDRKNEIAIAVKVNKDLINKLEHDRAFYEAAENQLARESRMIQSTIQALLAKSSSKVSYATGGFIWPIRGRITSTFGPRRHPIFGGRRNHTGIDISGPNRSPIKAANSGKVIFTGWYGGYGKVVIIDHGKSIATLYAHLSGISVSTGQSVSKGGIIGYEGSTGYSTGPHLHFEVRINGRPVNPLGYL